MQTCEEQWVLLISRKLCSEYQAKDVTHIIKWVLRRWKTCQGSESSPEECGDTVPRAKGVGLWTEWRFSADNEAFLEKQYLLVKKRIWCIVLYIVTHLWNAVKWLPQHDLFHQSKLTKGQQSVVHIMWSDIQPTQWKMSCLLVIGVLQNIAAT